MPTTGAVRRKKPLFVFFAARKSAFSTKLSNATVVHSKPRSPAETKIAPSFTCQSALLCAFQPKSVSPSKSAIQPSANSASVSGFGGSVTFLAPVWALAGNVQKQANRKTIDNAERLFMAGKRGGMAVVLSSLLATKPLVAAVGKTLVYCRACPLCSLGFARKDPSMSFTRREMLIASSATLTAGVVASRGDALLAADEKPTDKKFKKAVKIGMVREGSTLLDKCKLLKELGFDGVELDAPSGVTVEEAKRCIAETGLIVPGVVDSVHWNQRLS